MRNWLACGAPFVERDTPYRLEQRCIRNHDCFTQNCVDGTCRPTGDIIPTLPRPLEANWSAIYPALIQPCTACHSPNPATGEPPTGGLDMSDAATAYANLVGMPASMNNDINGASCGGAGRVRVIPGDPYNSLLVFKVSGIDPPCGMSMASFGDREFNAVRTWISMGACLADCALPFTAVHANGTCEAEVCGIRCDEGFADADGDRANGCEASL